MELMERRITIESICCSETQFLVSVMYRVLNMSKQARDVKLPCQNDLIAQCNDLMIQYNQLLCLRAELARLLLSRSKKTAVSQGSDYAQKSVGTVRRS